MTPVGVQRQVVTSRPAVPGAVDARWATEQAEQEANIDALTNTVTQRLIEVSRRQLKDEVQLAWQRHTRSAALVRPSTGRESARTTSTTVVHQRCRPRGTAIRSYQFFGTTVV